MKNGPGNRARRYLPAAPSLLLIVGLAPAAALAAPYAYVVNPCTSSSSCNNGTVSVVNAATDATVGTPIAVGNLPYGVATSPDGSHVYVTNSGSNSVSVIDTATNSVVATVSVGTYPYGVAISPDGKYVYVANACGAGASCSGSPQGTVSVIDAATDAVTATITVGQDPVGVAVSPDGGRVYVSNSGSNTVSVIDAATDTVIATVPIAACPDGLTVSPDGRRVYVATGGSPPSLYLCGAGTGTLSTIDTATDTPAVALNFSYNDAALTVALSPDGSVAYVTGNGIPLLMIDTATDTPLGSVYPPQALGTGSFAAGGVALSPDGSRAYLTFASSNSTQGTAAVAMIDTATDGIMANTAVGAMPISPTNYVFDTSVSAAFVGPGALIASNSSASGGAGTQVSGTVPTLTNATSCATTDAVVEHPAHGSVSFDGATGAFTYTPGSASYSGPDSFTWLGQATPVTTCPAANSPTYPASNTAAVSLTLDPLLTGLGAVTVGEGGSTQEAFSLTGSTPFTRTLATDNATVLPPAGVTISPAACGTAGNLACTLTLTSAAAAGTASVTITAKDTYGDRVEKTLSVTVAAPPTVTGLAPVNVTAPASATASFALTGTGTLTLTAASSNTALLPNSNITGASSCTAAGACRLGLAPAPDQTGSATVTVQVSDAYGQSTSGTFALTVNKPAAPTASGFSSVTLAAGQSGSEPFTDTGTGTLTVTATSSNTTLLPNSGITGASACTAAGSCTLTLNPISGQSGSATVTVTVADSYGQSATGTFGVTVKSSSTTTPTSSGGGGGGGAETPLGLLALTALVALAGLRRRRQQSGRS